MKRAIAAILTAGFMSLLTVMIGCSVACLTLF